MRFSISFGLSSEIIPAKLEKSIYAGTGGSSIHTVSTVFVNFSSGISCNTFVSFAVTHFLCYGLRREKVEMIAAGSYFPSCARIGTSPQGVDILNTEYQHFVLFLPFSLDRFFAVVYIAALRSRGIVILASGRPINPGNTATPSHGSCRAQSLHRGGTLPLPIAGAPSAAGAE